jgi:hypothetical protein
MSRSYRNFLNGILSRRPGLPRPLSITFFARVRSGGQLVDEDSAAAKAAYFRSVAARLRAIADEQQFDPRRRSQLLALAEGFDRHAERFERNDIG